MRLIFLIFFFMSTAMLFAQQQKATVKGFFLSDSVKVGEHIGYSLSVSYPSRYQAFFPDTTFDFQPFEFIKKEYFPTQKKNGLLHDSAVYYVRTFETDSLLVYSLPVFLFNAKDTVSVFSNLDSVFFKSVLPDTLQQATLLSNTSLVPIDLKPNYLFHLFIVLCIAVLVAMGWKLLGKRIMNQIRKVTTKRKHKNFILQFEIFKKSLEAEDNTQTWSLAIALWKKHTSYLTQRNIESMTTREICIELNNNSLKKPLQQIDNRIYGNVTIDIHSNLNFLLESAEQLFIETQTEKD